MSADTDLERDIRAALALSLGHAEGRFPVWGSSPQVQRLLDQPPRRWGLLPRRHTRVALAIAALVLVGTLVVASVRFVPALTPPGGCAGCGGSAIWAVAALDAQNVLGVGGTDDYRGTLVLVRSADGGATWRIERPDAPALTAIGVAGSRLYGSTDCLPTYPPEHGLPSGADVEYGSGVDHSFYPAAASCLYFSDDRGVTWHDAGAGRLVDPSFADASNGWSHSPFDIEGELTSTLYTTSDGGRTWRAEPAPCDAATPWIVQAMVTGPGSGYVLCAGPSVNDQAPWALVQVRPGAPPEVMSSTHTSTLQLGYGNFFIRADGTGLASADALYMTADGGRSWTPSAQRDDWTSIRGVSFASPKVGFAAFRWSGSQSGVETTNDGGLTWRPVADWDWWEFRPIPLPSAAGIPSMSPTVALSAVLGDDRRTTA